MKNFENNVPNTLVANSRENVNSEDFSQRRLIFQIIAIDTRRIGEISFFTNISNIWPLSARHNTRYAYTAIYSKIIYIIPKFSDDFKSLVYVLGSKFTPNKVTNFSWHWPPVLHSKLDISCYILIGILQFRLHVSNSS